MVVVPILLFWSLALWGFFSRKPVLIYLLFASMPFGSVAVLPPQITAGLTFTPAPIIALLIIARTFGNLRGLDFIAESAIRFRKLGLLALFWVVAVLTTIFMPRLMAGQVRIIPVRGLLNSAAPLYPTNQNISQLAYLTISIVAVFAFARLFQTQEMRQHALRALCLGAAVAIGTGVLDYLSQFISPIILLLEPFRTATYALLTDVEVLGGKRVIGLMPEASSFGSLCLGFLASLYFMRRAITDPRWRDVYSPVILLFLVLFTWLSTSSASMVGLGLFLTIAGVEWLWRFSRPRLSRRQRREVSTEFWLAFGGVTALVSILLFIPSILDPLLALVDRMVLQKTQSHSYEERGMWTAVSWQAAIDTFGIGVGLGSTRPSNAFVAVVSSTGFVGAALYYGFILLTLLRRAPANDPEGQILIEAVRWSFPPLFMISLVVGTTADFGTMGAFRYGLASAIGIAAMASAPRPRPAHPLAAGT